MKLFTNLRKNDPLRRISGVARWKRHEQLFLIVLNSFPLSDRADIKENYLKCLRACLAMMSFHSSNRDYLRSAQKRLETILRTIKDFDEGANLAGRLPTTWFSAKIDGLAPNDHLKKAQLAVVAASNFLQAQRKTLKRGRPVGDEKLLRALEELERFGRQYLRNVTVDAVDFWQILGNDVLQFDEALEHRNLVRDTFLIHAASSLVGRSVEFKRIQGLVNARTWKNLDPLF